MMWGAKVRRERFCTANTTEIAVMGGQKIRFSGRASSMPCGVWKSALARKINNGDTIKAKTHAEIERIANLSIIGAENLGRANSEKRIEALGILALFVRPRLMPLQVNREDRE